MSERKFISDNSALVSRTSLVLSISLMTIIFSNAFLSNEMDRSKVSDEVPVLSAPVEGVWRVINSPGHEPFAYDLAAVNPDTETTVSKSRFAHIFGQLSPKDFYSWQKSVKSPISGTVMEVSDEVPDREALNLILDLGRMFTSRPDLTADDIRPFAGNYIIIEAKGFYVFVAHLRSKSILVQAGDRVSAGQILGEVGNSGFTLEPHLHIQLVDQVDDLLAAAVLPFHIDSFEILVDGVWNPSSKGCLPKGKIVRFQ